MTSPGTPDQQNPDAKQPNEVRRNILKGLAVIAGLVTLGGGVELVRRGIEYAVTPDEREAPPERELIFSKPRREVLNGPVIGTQHFQGKAVQVNPEHCRVMGTISLSPGPGYEEDPRFQHQYWIDVVVKGQLENIETHHDFFTLTEVIPSYPRNASGIIKIVSAELPEFHPSFRVVHAFDTDEATHTVVRRYRCLDQTDPEQTILRLAQVKMLYQLPNGRNVERRFYLDPVAFPNLEPGLYEESELFDKNVSSPRYYRRYKYADGTEDVQELSEFDSQRLIMPQRIGDNDPYLNALLASNPPSPESLPTPPQVSQPFNISEYTSPGLILPGNPEYTMPGNSPK